MRFCLAQLGRNLFPTYCAKPNHPFEHTCLAKEVHIRRCGDGVMLLTHWQQKQKHPTPPYPHHLTPPTPPQLAPLRPTLSHRYPTPPQPQPHPPHSTPPCPIAPQPHPLPPHQHPTPHTTHHPTPLHSSQCSLSMPARRPEALGCRRSRRVGGKADWRERWTLGWRAGWRLVGTSQCFSTSHQRQFLPRLRWHSLSGMDERGGVEWDGVE